MGVFVNRNAILIAALTAAAVVAAMVYMRRTARANRALRTQRAEAEAPAEPAAVDIEVGEAVLRDDN